MACADRAETARDAGAGEVAPGGDVGRDDGEGEVLFGHRGGEGWFVVGGGGGEADVVE